MSRWVNFYVVKTLALRTFRQAVESPVAYVVAFLFYGFIGGIFGLNYFDQGHASINGVGGLVPWLLLFVAPALTMGLLSEEIRSGTFEGLSTLPIRDWEIVLGKFLGYSLLVGILICGLLFFPLVVSFTVASTVPQGIDWGASVGIIGASFFLALSFGSMGIFASSLVRNQVVVFIVGVIFCLGFYFIGMVASYFPGVLARLADFLGVISHIDTMARGVWDFRDIFYLGSLTLFFLYLTVQRLSSRRF